MQKRSLKLVVAMLPFLCLFQAPACTVFVDPIRIFQGYLLFRDCEIEFKNGRIDEIDCD